ncbi:cobyrinate a,c-diamide synthase [Cohnella sp. CFH 77786]|uniref:cobyrinate a,c-diamide synthase n=1 Tax=Cohnella sp. CFH 77786 TaxID=2662265 RepID=UPI001C609A58|nr:cobyrinate a,c-diamide synthase [Cohnella sp. CFH 77786]MBW5447605.1 cobyrinate a,c-diamide synthase [Cohnella sp. CFH 77786]
MPHRRIIVAGTGSGVGKTTVTIGLMAALRRKGYRVQGFKCGPDYIDPTYHAAATGRVSRNLDSWMFPPDVMRQIYNRAAQDADISVIEGVMGYYDGKNPRTNEGSTAEIGILLDGPAVLVVNCHSMARSAAAIVKGFQMFDPRVRIAGVIANRIGSDNHYRLVQEAIEQECGIPVIGHLKREETFEIPERHLGLVPSIERGDLQPLFDRLAEAISATCDLDLLMRLAEAGPVEAGETLFAPRFGSAEYRAKIAVAKDAAFHFYYPENLELLEAFGAKLVYFSPLAGETLPEEADGLYIGGGFPEQFAAELAADDRVQASIRGRIEAGLPTLAECGGFMYLTREIEDTQGRTFPMLGLVPGRVKMQTKLAALGYREITGTEGNFFIGPDHRAKGHEFHYSVFEPEGEANPVHAYETKGMRGLKKEGVLFRNVVAGYTHFHFASEPGLAERFVAKCARYREERDGCR